MSSLSPTLPMVFSASYNAYETMWRTWDDHENTYTDEMGVIVPLASYYHGTCKSDLINLHPRRRGTSRHKAGAKARQDT